MTVHAADVRASAARSKREELSLDGVWRFRLDGHGDWRNATVPQPWQAEFADLRNASGRATYVREFSLPANWGNREVAVCFGAVNYFAEVLLNGQVLGTHEGGYLPFEFVLPRELLKGENTLEVRATLPTGDAATYPDHPFGEIPHGKQSWYGPLGGIWQSVKLEVRDPRHIRHVAIRSSVDGAVEIAIEMAGDGQAAATVYDAGNAVVANGAISGGTARLMVDQPALWSPEHPNLYTVEIALQAGGAVVDTLRESFGFRSIESRDGKFYLNGKPLYLRGALDQDYYPEGICTPPSLEFLEDQARKAKALGLNLLRCHIKVPDPRYHEVADRLGLLIWTEIPNVQSFTGKSAQRLRDTMSGILRRDGNHPSIIAWTIINEDWGTRLVENEDHRGWLKQTYDWLKGEDPTRLVVDNSPCFPNFHMKTDINDYHYYRSVPERRGEWDDLTQQFAAGADWTFSSLGDAERRGDEPLVVSEFGVWGLPRPQQVRTAEGREPFWMETGSGWGDGAAYPHGIETRFATYHLDTVFKSFDAFIENVQWYQFANLKYEIEAMRAYPSIQGYVITEFTDVHWEANGLLDINRNPRAFHDRFHEVNADIVIVPRVDRYAGWAGETLTVDLGIATGGHSIPAGATLSWSGPISGSAKVPATQALALADLGKIELRLPKLAKAERISVRFRLEAGGKVLSENTLELSVYPERQTTSLPSISAEDTRLAGHLAALGYKVDTPARADLRIVNALAAADIEAMRAGARYLVLADGSAKTHRNLRTDIPEGEAPYRKMIVDSHNLPVGIDQQLPGIGLVTRDGTMWRGDWIANFSWIKREGAFAALPGGPLLDPSFDRVVPHHVMTGFRSWEYEGLVHGGVVIGWIQKPAVTIAERRVGKGSLVATTFRLTGDTPGFDPVATALLDAMITTAIKGR
ncbi:MAG TPA: glycoside hydrolase family 2 TIM barrel-domain containing protein [Devosiaceae bacterium]|jgi:hypothetical protein